MFQQMRRISLVIVLVALCTKGVAAADGKYALVVGVENYDPSHLARLEFAEDDALATGKALESLGFDVVVMTSKARIPERRPVFGDDILQQLRRRLRDRRSSDTVVVTLSGHGVQLKNDPRDTNGAKETYFCAERSKPSKPDTLLPMSEIIRALEECEAGRKLLVVDACRNEVQPRDVRTKSVEITLDPVGASRKAIPKGLVAFFSCKSRQRSFELKKLGHSVFTHFLLKYLTGDAKNSGDISLLKLTDYVTRSTRDYIDTQFNKNQEPELLFPEATFQNWSLGELNRRDEVRSSIGLKLVKIPAGRFFMGSRESPFEVAYAFAGENPATFELEHPRRERQISKPFYMSAHEITRQQFRQFVREEGYRTDRERGVILDNNPTGASTLERSRNWINHQSQGMTEQHPVTFVSWNDAKQFCNWLSRKEGRTVRLPTQAEWEYACRGGTSSRYWTGDDPKSLWGAAQVPCGRSEVDIVTLRYFSGDKNRPNNGWIKVAMPRGSDIGFEYDQDQKIWTYRSQDNPSNPGISLYNQSSRDLFYSPTREYQELRLNRNASGVPYALEFGERDFDASGLAKKSKVAGASFSEDFL